MSETAAEIVKEFFKELKALSEEKAVPGLTVFQGIEEFLLHLEAKGRSERTIGTYQERLHTFAEVYGYTELTAVRPRDLDAYLAAMRRQQKRYEDHPRRETERGHLSPATVAGRIQALKTFFRWCNRRGYTEKDIAADLARPSYDPTSESRAMDPNDLEAMIEVAKKKAVVGAKPRDYALILFLADTAARIGEAITLRIGDLDLDRLEAWVDGKTGRRVVDFTEATSRALRYWLSVRPEADNSFVFVSTAPRQLGEPMTGSSAYQAMRRLATKAGVQGRFNPHSIRHLVGQIYTDETNLELARQKLGHASITTTARHYANQDRSRLKKATQRLSLVERRSESRK